jgi:hypothetical protein
MTAEEQNQERRIAAIRAEKYAGRSVVIEEVDNWKNMMSTQIGAMRRRGNLPEHFTYTVKEDSK